MEVVCRREAAE